MPPVDVAIVNFNSGPWLGRCLDALFDSDVDISITVVDNASTDDSLALAQLTQRRHLSCIRNQTNLGFGTAVNQALARATGQTKLIINPDCELQPNALARLADALAVDPQVGIVAPLVVGEDGLEQRASRRRTPTPLRSLVTALGLERLGFTGVNIADSLPEGPVEAEAVSGAALLIRGACWVDLGGYDPAYFLHVEDLDLFRRARLAGWKILFVPDAVARHVKGVSHGSAVVVSERHKLQGMLRYYRKFDSATTPVLLRWLWPLAARLRFVLLLPWWTLKQRRAR